MQTPDEINAASRYRIEYRPPRGQGPLRNGYAEDWQTFEETHGQGFRFATRWYHNIRQGTLSDSYSRLVDLNSGQTVASSAPAHVYDHFRH